MTTTKTGARFMLAETITRGAMYLLLAVGLAYVLFQFDHLNPSWMIAWVVVFAALTVSKIAFGTQARR